MKFVRVQQLSEAAAALRDKLQQNLADGKDVLWLVSGGSNIELSVRIMQELPEDLTAGLTIMLMDERYGEPGHADSNDAKLVVAGFAAKRANWLHVLQPGFTLQETTQHFAAAAAQAFKQADIVIGQFGMGADGHTAGLLPGSPAISSADFAIGFAWSDFQRITLTPGALTGVTTAYLLVKGEDKRPQLETLQSSDLSIDQQPVQLLKQLPETYIYNDQIGDAI